MSAGPLADGRREVLRRRIRWIVAGTIVYNAVEAVVAIAAGALASSTALVAFGLDSVVEVLSAVAVAWQFSARDPESRERVALRLIAVSFFVLSAYVVADTGISLLIAREAEPSVLGIILSAVSLAVMPAISLLERRTGQQLGSATAVADSKQTLLCAYLSATLLLGLLLNALLGWWWADSVAAVVIAAWAVKEGVEAWRGDACVEPVGVLTGEQSPARASGHRSLDAEPPPKS